MGVKKSFINFNLLKEYKFRFMVTFRQFDEELKKEWHGTNERVPVNRSIFVYVSKEKEEQFIKNMFPTEAQRQKYFNYRKEWYRRAKEFDPGT